MEKWEPITNYEGLYEVSDLGRVKSLARARRKNDLILKGGGDYKNVVLSNDRGKKSIRIHRLVAQAFIQNPKNKPEVNHKDGVKANNFATNLEWATRLENVQHAIRTNLTKNDHRAKSVRQLTNDGILIRVWSSAAEAARKLRANNICSCCKGNIKTSAGFRWEYAQ